MTRIPIAPQADPVRVLEVVRTTLDARGYHWEQTDPDRAVASEGGKPIGGMGTGFSRDLRVSIRLDEGDLKISQDTHGAAMTGASGSPFLQIALGRRFSKLMKAVRADLVAAGMSTTR